MTILITGIAGFIGYNFISYYLNKYPTNKIIGIDKLTYASNIKNLSQLTMTHKPYFTLAKGDITDKHFINSLFKDYDITSVINFAAETHVDRSIKDSSEFISTNITGTHTLLDICKKYWFKNGTWENNTKFLQISTDEVYGSLENDGKFSESSQIDPHNPYSASKAAADLIVKSYYQTYKMPILITRSSNNYGPYQIPEKLIPLIIQNTLLHKQLPIYGNGEQIRDWLYVEDNCKAINLVFNKGTLGQIYNIGGNCEMKNIDLVKLIIKLINKKTNDPYITNNLISYVTDRLGHDKRYALDCTKIKEELRWEPKMKIKDGLNKTIDWYMLTENLRKENIL